MYFIESLIWLIIIWFFKENSVCSLPWDLLHQNLQEREAGERGDGHVMTKAFQLGKY